MTFIWNFIVNLVRAVFRILQQVHFILLMLLEATVFRSQDNGEKLSCCFTLWACFVALFLVITLWSGSPEAECGVQCETHHCLSFSRSPGAGEPPAGRAALWASGGASGGAGEHTDFSGEGKTGRTEEVHTLWLTRVWPALLLCSDYLLRWGFLCKSCIISSLENIIWKCIVIVHASCFGADVLHFFCWNLGGTNLDFNFR